MTSAYQFYQYWVNVDDRDVSRHLKVFTFLAREEIADHMERHAGNPGARIPHKALARDVTSRVHGRTAAARAAEASAVLFGDADPRGLDAGAWEVLAAELPAGTLALSQPLSAVDLVAKSALCKSKSEARRLLSQGGISLNGVPLSLEASISATDALAGGYLWLRRGKKADFILRVSP